ncbi:MAG: UDP-glucose/GDP-mannose dehydrogenase family protein [Candidatus Altiarchaeota archaeon]|nr:UDP-glucose/GDP-mannose dehydrogenase family protein [Candidatus Altiarchaeota archaeon]
MDVSVIGTGYVGLVTGAGLAEKGHNVICYDIIKEKIKDIERGVSPIYEKGLDTIIKRNIGEKLNTSMDLESTITDSEITFICVGTPSNEDGSINLRYVKNACREIGAILKNKKKYHLIVVKSTVVPGTTEEVVIPLLEESSGKKAYKDFGVVMSPEFLREGVAVEDFLKPDRIIIGANDKRSSNKLKKLYDGFNCPVLGVDIKTAEMTKYASNAFLAVKISYINEIGNICKKLGIDVYDVAKGMAFDHRISKHFLNAGLGFGGSCLPKDVKALIHRAKELDYRPRLLDSAIKVNEKQAARMLDIAREKLKSFENKKIAVLGAAFKAGTDDIRESPIHPLINSLLKEKARVSVYDPQANSNLKEVYNKRINYADSADDALMNADLALIVTAWAEFELLDYSLMRNLVVVDGRRIVKKNKDMDYEGLCW